MTNGSTLYQTMKAAEAKFATTGLVADIAPLEVSEKAYFAAVAAKKAEWKAIPEGNKKDSAENNAYDTCEENSVSLSDEIYWLEMAFASYELA